MTTDSDHIGQINLGEEELKVRRIGHDARMEQDAVHIGYEADATAHLLETNGKSHRASGHRSGSECDADKDLGKNGLHEGKSNSDESPTGSSQSRSNLRSRQNTNNGPPHGRTGSLDKLPGGRESGRRRPIHFRQRFQRFCQEF